MAGKKQGRTKGRSTGGGQQLRRTQKPAGEAMVAPVRVPKYCLSEAAVQAILSHKREPFVVRDDIDDPELRSLLLEAAADHEEIEDRRAAHKVKVREELEANGFVALLDDFEEKRAALNAASKELFQRMLGEDYCDDKAEVLNFLWTVTV